MITYLAGRYSRRLELCGYRDELTVRGLTVRSRWLDGGHQIADDGMPLTKEGERRFETGDSSADHLRGKFAQDDLEDVLACDLLIAFTEEPDQARGGRHVELGIALGATLAGSTMRERNRRIIICGPRENLFCWLPLVENYPDWPSLLTAINNRQFPAPVTFAFPHGTRITVDRSGTVLR